MAGLLLGFLVSPLGCGSTNTAAEDSESSTSSNDTGGTTSNSGSATGGSGGRGAAETGGSTGAGASGGSGGGSGGATSTSTTGGSGGSTGAGASGGSGGSGGAPATPLYLVSIDHWASPSVLRKIDIDTGVGTIACTLPDSVDGVNYHSSTFSRNGVLFASNANDATLDIIEPCAMSGPCTCAVTVVGSTGANLPGITANKSNGLHGVEVTYDDLLTIDPMTAATTPVGPLLVDFTNTGATWSDALNGGQGGIYAIHGAENSLYTINPMTGAATKVIDITGVTFNSVGIEVHPANGVIYACTNDKILYEIDPMTGVADKIGPGMGHTMTCNNLAAPWGPIPWLDAL